MSSYLKRLLIAVDSSEHAFNTVRYVADLFPHENMEVVLFSVKPNPPMLGVEAWEGAAAWAEQQEKVINDFMVKARKLLLERRFSENAVAIKVEEVNKGVARDILTESQQGYDAVLLGRRGLNPVSELVLGSISHKLLHKMTHVPICVVGGVPRVNNFIMGIDSSDGAMRAVNHAGRMFSGIDATVTLLHVIPTFDYLTSEFDATQITSVQAEMEEDQRRAMEETFKKATDALERDGFARDRIKTEIVAGAHSRAGAIVDKAEEYGIGTIVLGRRGLSNVEEFLLGRVSNKVIHLAKNEAVWVVN
ncbi:MAG: universal stress protein [Deltaproteobacteria bacterium]|nr:universal stress protein [Deltaproteobacteria bacterium]